MAMGKMRQDDGSLRQQSSYLGRRVGREVSVGLRQRLLAWPQGWASVVVIAEGRWSADGWTRCSAPCGRCSTNFVRGCTKFVSEGPSESERGRNWPGELWGDGLDLVGDSGAGSVDLGGSMAVRGEGGRGNDHEEARER